MPAFWLSGQLPGLNSVTAKNRANRYSGAKQKRAVEQALVLQIKAARFNPIDCFCDWRFTWHEPNRRRDPDNIYSACKFIFDALQYADRLPRDSWKYVGRVTHECVVNDNVGVLVEFERREER